MKKLMIIVILATALPFKSDAQDLQDLTDRLGVIISTIPREISSEDECVDLIHECEDLQNDISEVLKDENIPPNDVKNLKATMEKAETLEKFIRTVGNTKYAGNFLSEKQLRSAQELLNFQITEVFKDKFCIQVFEIKINEHVCVLAYKKGVNEVYTIEVKTKSDNGRTSNKIEMGLKANHYRRLWSYSNTLNSAYVITSAVCSKTF